MTNIDAAERALTAVKEALEQPEVPDHGLEAAKVINKYAEHAADYIDKNADDIMQEVIAYKEACNKLSAEMRRITKAHADRTVSLTVRLRDAATGVSKVTKEFFGDDDQSLGPSVSTPSVQRKQSTTGNERTNSSDRTID